MDKNAIRKFAVWARRELIARVSQRAERFGVTEAAPGDPRAESVSGHLLTDTERRQRAALIARIGKHGYKAVMEEAAYTWFNRFCALRFMEVNGFLPTRIRVFTDEQNGFRPQILTEAIHMELDGLDMERVYQLKSDSDDEALYKYLLITQCNALCSILPGMFTPIADYTGLLMPDNLLREGSVIEQMIALIPEEDWRDQVQIIGWLYQYYNAEPKDEVFANLKRNIKISKRDIPAATQLFTPDWIVRYMVENSLGRLWVEGHPDEALKAGWRYYLEEAEQEPQVQSELTRIRAEYARLQPEDIRCIDPCMGSGHILVYMFDVLLQIYQAYGYSTREAVQSILQNNLYGLDIDDRAAQLAYFAVMMKARKEDRRFFSRGIQPHVYAIAESDNWQETEAIMKRAFASHPSLMEQSALRTAKALFDAFADGKEYGSLIEPCVTLEDLTLLSTAFGELREKTDLIDMTYQADVAALAGILEPLMEQARILVQRYNVVVTNPPYMGSSNMGARLSDFVKKAYPDSKSDLFAVFIERCGEMTQKNDYQAMITQHAWMFLSSFEKLRAKLLKVDTVNMVHLGARAFEEIGGEVVQTTSFLLRKNKLQGYKCTYVRLIEPTTQQGKKDMFLAGQNRFVAQQDNFSKIPGAPVAYWINCSQGAFEHTIRECFVSGGRNKTHNDEKYVRYFWEISNCSPYWRRYLNGGNYRKFYGNNNEVVLWSNSAKAEYMSHGGLLKDESIDGVGIYWNKITSNVPGFCLKEQGWIFSSNAPTIISHNSNDVMCLLGFLNSCILSYYLEAINPTMTTNVGDILAMPLCKANVGEIVDCCLCTSKADWDSFETSWDFQRQPVVQYANPHPIDATVWSEVNCYIKHCYENWERECNERFAKLKANEEELNRIFIDIYGLKDELTPEVEDRDVTVRRADLGRDMRSLISYAVGCMFGRYSIYKPGLMYAGGKWDYRVFEQAAREDEGKPKEFEFYDSRHFLPDKDGILPITDDEYFGDDIVGRFVEFVATVFGSATLEENLRFIARALGGNGTPRQVIRSYFLNDFYADHLKVYQKRPIYWLFDSGKKNGFKCLIYMHRYAPDTIARIRTDYVHEQQSRYRTAIADLEKRIASAPTAERVKLQKQLAKVGAQADELRAYEEKIHHLADQMIAIDLDDGVKVNYAKFQDVLAKIK